MHPIERLRMICKRNGLALTDAQADALRAYGELLSSWNRRLNLVSRRDQEDLWFAHILHSLSPWFVVRLPPAAVVLDLGTGGGLPGVPLAILRNDLQVVLLDSVKKKSAALQEIVRELALPNAEVRTGRAEEKAFGELFRCDFVIARAVAPLADLIRWSRPLLRASESLARGPGLVPPGTLLAMKGGDLAAELRMATIKHGTLQIDIRDLHFEGSHEAGLVDKKLLLVSLP